MSNTQRRQDGLLYIQPWQKVAIWQVDCTMFSFAFMFTVDRRMKRFSWMMDSSFLVYFINHQYLIKNSKRRVFMGFIPRHYLHQKNIWVSRIIFQKTEKYAIRTSSTAPAFDKSKSRIKFRIVGRGACKTSKKCAKMQNDFIRLLSSLIGACFLTRQYRLKIL